MTRKNIVLFEKFYLASESLKRIGMYKVISGKMAISENGFDRFKAKQSPIQKLLTFSSHLDLKICESIKNFEI